MGRTCKKCGQQTGPDRRLCKMCSLDKRYGNDFETASDVDDEPDELEHRCVKCGHEQVGTLSDDCEECGERRWRYIGPLPGESDHEEQLRADGGRPTEEEMLDAELGLKNRTDEFATDGGQLTQRQQRQAEKLQQKHAAEQGREQRLQTALETGEVGKQGQRIWIIPEFEPDEAESDLIQDSVREALPAYDCQVVVDRTKPITKDRIHDMLLGSGEEDDVRTDGGRSAGNPETRLGEARKQLRILLDDVEFDDEDTAEYVEGALACAESAAVCLEGPEVLEDEE